MLLLAAFPAVCVEVEINIVVYGLDGVCEARGRFGLIGG